MNSYSQSQECISDVQGAIFHYRLDFQKSRNHHYYVWRHHPPEEIRQKKIALLVDLNNVHIPDFEIEKMVYSFLIPTTGIISIAFTNCHSHNQREIKRKLKEGSIELYSRTAFFMDIEQARQWLKAKCTSDLTQ